MKKKRKNPAPKQPRTEPGESSIGVVTAFIVYQDRTGKWFCSPSLELAHRLRTERPVVPDDLVAASAVIRKDVTAADMSMHVLARLDQHGQKGGREVLD